MRVVNSFIGSPVRRIEDARFLRGAGEYVGDLTRPGLLHACILRSPVAHGRLRSVDATAALAIAGVHCVITAADLPQPIPMILLRQESLPAFKAYEQPVIAHAKVRYVGEPIAIVLAESAAIAEDALSAIVVDIEPLPAVVDARRSEQNDVLLFEESGTNRAAILTAVRGDVDAGFSGAAYVRRERFCVQRHTAAPLELRGLLAEWDGKRLKVSGAAKVPFTNRRIVAEQLDLPESAVDLVENDVGGAFGVRGEFYPEDFLIPFAARHIGRPVKWIEDRREHLLTINHAREADCELEIACDADGTIRALRGRAHADMGAYLRTNGATAARNIAQVLSGPYRVPHIRIDVALQMTDKTPVGTYRGPGRFEADFFRERLFDIAAQELGVDRVEFRRRNLVSDAEMPYRLATVMPLDMKTECDNGDYRVTLEKCLAEFGWTEKAALQGQLVEGRYHGLALGCYIEGGASGPREHARVALDPDGAFSVYVGSSGIGQGLETVCTQIAADALEVPLGKIRGVFHGSTTYLAEGFGSYSSRSVVMGGSAIVAAANTLRQAMREAAARRLGCTAGEIDFADDKLTGPGGSVSFAELGSEALAADGVFASTKRTYSYGAHAAHVAVDAETGHVELVDYVAVEDVGRIINPLTLHGQTVGAIVQGLGGALLEQLVYNDEGQLATVTLADYLMPTAPDFPRIRVTAMELKPSPNNPLGAKGAGEGGIIPVGGVIANAVASALARFDVQPNELPLSPPRLWAMIHDAPRAT